MRSVKLGQGGMQSSALGFGCSGVMGRVGRKGSLTALGAAYDAGITLYDTARSYGYGDSEGLLGEFLRGRRDSVIVSTKFGIVHAHGSWLKRAGRPVARQLLKAVPALRGNLRSQMAAQFSAGHFSVEAMRSSVEMSLRQLQTGFIDLLFLHLPPLSVVHQEDLFAALEQLRCEGKVLRVGIAAEVPVARMVLDAKIPTLRMVQAPCNVFDLSLTKIAEHYPVDVVALANHPFGGPHGLAEGKERVQRLSQAIDVPASLREKLRLLDDAALADLTLNMIISETGIKVVIPSMLHLDHLRMNVAAMEHSRFTAAELQWVREQLGK